MFLVVFSDLHTLKVRKNKRIKFCSKICSIEYHVRGILFEILFPSVWLKSFKLPKNIYKIQIYIK